LAKVKIIIEAGGTSFYGKYIYVSPPKHTYTCRLPGAASKWHRKQPADGGSMQQQQKLGS
jgi:hypothetical protein